MAVYVKTGETVLAPNEENIYAAAEVLGVGDKTE